MAAARSLSGSAPWRPPHPRFLARPVPAGWAGLKQGNRSLETLWLYSQNGGRKVTPSAGANRGSLTEMFTVPTAGDVQPAALGGCGGMDLAGRGRLCWCLSVLITVGKKKKRLK